MAEREMLALEAVTVDQVAPGEQQSESDHFYRGERSGTGTHNDRFWRNSVAWFSYDLVNRNYDGRILRITYNGQERDRNFDILINDVLISSVELKGEQGNSFFDVQYEIPENLWSSNDKLTIKFQAHQNSSTASIFYIRLLRDNPDTD
jgi:uncharacterized protein